MLFFSFFLSFAFYLFQDLLDELQEKYPELDARLPQLLSVAFALSSVESRSLGLPDFPLENIEKVAAQLVNTSFNL